MSNSEKERLIELEKFVEEISKMSLIKGIGQLENLYNSIVSKAYSLTGK